VKLIVVALFLSMSAAASAAGIANLEWLSGDWVQCTSEGVIEERWVGPRAEVMVAVNLSVNGARASYEFMRIAPGPNGVLTYYAQPGGASPPVGFPLKTLGERRAVFENTSHDFPQRVVYWREGNRLRARIEGTIDGVEEAMEWAFLRYDAADPCER
jgi:hypothetical protein